MSVYSKRPHDRSYYRGKLSSSWISLLLFAVLTAVNVISAATGSDGYFLFSAAIPYFLVVMGMEMCGMYPEEYYLEYYEEIPEFLDPSFFAIALAIAIAFILITALITLFVARGKRWAIVAALVLVGIDTVAAMLVRLEIIDILFHGWLLYDLVMAFNAHKALAEMPEDTEDSDGDADGESFATDEYEDISEEPIEEAAEDSGDDFSYFTEDNRGDR